MALKEFMAMMLLSNYKERPSAHVLMRTIKCFKYLYEKIKTIAENFKIRDFEYVPDYVHDLPLKIYLEGIQSVEKQVILFIKGIDSRKEALVNNNKIRLI